MYRIVTMIFLLLVALGPAYADDQEGQRQRPVGFTQKTLASGSTVAIGATWTSASFDVRYSEVQSIYWSATGSGGAAAGTLAVQCSIDGTNFADPATPTVATISANGSGIRGLSIPLSRYIRFTFTNTSGRVTTWTAIAGCQ